VDVEVTDNGRVAALFETAVDAFATVDTEVDEMLEDEEGADACTKCFKLVDDDEEITALLLFGVLLGVRVVLFV
jgi:hypothetical protein